jgi:hypothetical protein
MREADGPRVRWHSHSSANGQCVEVAPVAGPLRFAIPGTRPARDWSSPARPGWPLSKL